MAEQGENCELNNIAIPRSLPLYPYLPIYLSLPPSDRFLTQGKMCGVLEDLVSLLGECSPRLVTYAGGASSLVDLDRVSAAISCSSGITSPRENLFNLTTKKRRRLFVFCFLFETETGQMNSYPGSGVIGSQAGRAHSRLAYNTYQESNSAFRLMKDRTPCEGATILS